MSRRRRRRGSGGNPPHGRKPDLYVVDCANLEPAESPREPAAEKTTGDEEIVAERINVGDNERIIVFRKSQKKGCTRYVLRDVFD